MCHILCILYIVTDSKVDCPSETDQYGLAWPGARSGETVGQACSENGNLCGKSFSFVASP